MINTMKIAILGFGREGKSTLKFLKKNNPKAEIKILDQKLDKNYLKNLSDFDIVYRTPGVPYNLPEIQKAIKNGVKFSSNIQLFLENFKGKTIGITGTKGKGTTATLLYKILKACGKNVFLAGNIGKSALGLLSKIKKDSIVILELSSFQLQDLKKSPNIAVILDIFPDHLDSHKNVQEYFEAKSAISKFQNPNDKVFYSADNKYSASTAKKSRGEKFPVQYQDVGHPGFWMSDIQKLIKMPGEHNFKNAVMATIVALSLGCPKEKILKVIKNFRGNEHRLELTRKISGINFFNDSASTNPQTATAAIRAFKEPKILIAGGKDKGLNYSPLSQAIKNSNTKLVVLFGENKNKITKAISGNKNKELRIMSVKNLKQAVQLAHKTAKKLIPQFPNSPIIVIFSPAAASFDMFKDYADRGRKFKELVRKLK